MAWEYGTNWVHGYLERERRYVADPPPAVVYLSPVERLRHHESEDKAEEVGSEAQGVNGGPQGGEGLQNVTAASGPVVTPPRIAPPSRPQRSQHQRLRQSPQSAPQQGRHHLQRCPRPRPQPGESAQHQPQGHSCPGNGHQPPKKATQSGPQRRQPLRCNPCSSRLGGDQRDQQDQQDQPDQKGPRRTSSGRTPGQRSDGCGS